MRLIYRIFSGSVGVVLMITSAAKLAAAVGSARILNLEDPLFIFQIRRVLVLTGFVELLLAMYLLFGSKAWLKVPLVAWLATSFLIYRLGLLWMGVHKPCGCFGTITDALSIPPTTIDLLMKIVLAYLLVGSYGLLLLEWWQGRKPADTKPSELVRGDAQV